MKQIIVILLVILLIPFTIYAGEGSTKRSAGDKALLFSLNGLGNLGADDFMGAGFGMKYYFTNTVAGRIALGFGMTNVTEKATTPTGADQKTSRMMFEIAPGVQVDFARSSTVTGYIGGQILFGMGSETVENPNFVSNNKTEESSTYFGAGAFMGAEWFAWENVSLSAEYHLDFTTQSGKMKQTVNNVSTEVDAPSTTTISLGSSSGASFTISFYL